MNQRINVEAAYYAWVLSVLHSPRSRPWTLGIPRRTHRRSWSPVFPKSRFTGLVDQFWSTSLSSLIYRVTTGHLRAFTGDWVSATRKYGFGRRNRLCPIYRSRSIRSGSQSQHPLNTINRNSWFSIQNPSVEREWRIQSQRLGWSIATPLEGQTTHYSELQGCYHTFGRFSDGQVL